MTELEPLLLGVVPEKIRQYNDATDDGVDDE